jgi:hypothetical protein
MVSDRVPGPLPYADERAEINDAARATAARPNFPAAYIAAAGERFALRTADTDDVRAALALLEEQTNISVSAPVESRNRGISALKLMVRKSVFFTTNHLAEQMRALGWATVSVGEAAAERIEKLEARVIELESRLAALDQGPSES